MCMGWLQDLVAAGVATILAGCWWEAAAVEVEVYLATAADPLPPHPLQTLSTARSRPCQPSPCVWPASTWPTLSWRVMRCAC